MGVANRRSSVTIKKCAEPKTTTHTTTYTTPYTRSPTTERVWDTSATYPTTTPTTYTTTPTTYTTTPTTTPPTICPEGMDEFKVTPVKSHKDRNDRPLAYELAVNAAKHEIVEVTVNGDSSPC